MTTQSPQRPDRWQAPDAAPYEREDDELTQAVWQALGDQHEEEASFAAEVQARIDAHQKELRNTPAFATRAASFLPPFLLPKALLPLAGSTGQKAGASFWTGWLSLPVLALATFVFSGIAWVRFIAASRNHGPQQSDLRSYQLEIADWWRANLVKALVMIAAVLLLLFYAPIDALVLGLGLSTLALFGILTRLGASGFATRREVGTVAYQFLSFAVYIGWQFSVSRGLGAEVQVGHIWVMPILAFAAAICIGLARGQRRTWILAGVAATALTSLHLLIFTPVLGGPRFGERPLEVEKVIARLEDPQQGQRFQNPVDWGPYANAYRMWEASGRPMKPWLGLRAGMRSTMEAQVARSEFNSLYAWPMLELGELTAEDVPKLRNPYKWEHQFDEKYFYHSRSDDIQLRLRAMVESWTPQQAAHLAANIQRRLDPQSQYRNLRDYRLAGQSLDLLGFSKAADALAPTVHQLLRDTYQTTPKGKQACFQSYPTEEGGKPFREPVTDRLTFVSMDSTAEALLAMQRWGIPDGLALLPVERYLEEMTLVYDPQDPPDHAVLAAACRDWLRAVLPQRPVDAEPVPTPHPWDWWLDRRLLLATLLLAAGGIWSTSRAPRHTDGWPSESRA